MKPWLFKPKWNEPCLCGSGKKYKACCWKKLPGFDIGKQYSFAVARGDFERALLACRADIVQYTIWHKSHTEPALVHHGIVEEVLSIDVKALAEYVERLFWLYTRTSRIAGWLTVLERLRENIIHLSWRRKIGYFRALSHLGPDGDRSKAKQELARIGPITPAEDDVELLQIYVDLEFDHEPFAAKLKFIDRILQVSTARSDQLQYRGAKAVQYFLIGDTTTAERELEETVRLTRETESDKPLDSYERNLMGRLLQMLGSLRDDRKLMREAVGHFNLLLLDDNWTKSGRAMLHHEIGGCYKYEGAWNDAEKAFREALEILDTPLNRIHLAEALLYQKRIDEAAAEIAKVDRSILIRPEHEDYVFAFAAIATWAGKAAVLKEAKSLLEELSTTEPYFNERRLTLLLGITQALAKGVVSDEAKASSTPEGGIVSVTSNILILQPNIMGFGINFNAIIDYFLKKKPTK